MDRFGFIHEKLDIKILILFILRRLPGVVDRETLGELCQCDNGIGYFDYSDCLAELVDTAHITEEDGKYRVTVMHRNHKGDSEAETYLVRETEGVLFIETGFAVMMDYDREKDRIRLSPGGEYRRKSDGTLKQ